MSNPAVLGLLVAAVIIYLAAHKLLVPLKRDIVGPR